MMPWGPVLPVLFGQRLCVGDWVCVAIKHMNEARVGHGKCGQGEADQGRAAGICH